jgi:DNA-binding HxlR family transcriptional regulator
VRSYNQFCALARTLDLLGERWTLLVIRELLLGPRRFTDLLSGLPGIAPNLLSDRLRMLEGQGLITRATLPPPAASRVYELTHRGTRLQPALLELARWGMQPMEPPEAEEHRQPAWYAVALQAAFRPELAHDVEETYGFVVDDVAFHLEVADGEAQARYGSPAAPAFVLRTPLENFLPIATRTQKPQPSELEGSAAAFQRFTRLFPLPEPGLGAAA